MGKKIRRFMNGISELLELIMAAVVLVAIIVALFSLKGPFTEFVNNYMKEGAFLTFMGYILNIVIGIEFFKMLCKPGADTVLEVLMFVIARHMIIHDTNAVENLLTIVGIAIIFVIKKYFHTTWEDHDEGALRKRLFKKRESDKEDVDSSQSERFPPLQV